MFLLNCAKPNQSSKTSKSILNCNVWRRCCIASWDKKDKCLWYVTWRETIKHYVVSGIILKKEFEKIAIKKSLKNREKCKVCTRANRNGRVSGPKCAKNGRVKLLCELAFSGPLKGESEKQRCWWYSLVKRSGCLYYLEFIKERIDKAHHVLWKLWSVYKAQIK